MQSIEKQLGFYFLGARNYVNGLTLFESMMKAYQEETAEDSGIEKITNFKVKRFIRNNCRLVIRETREKMPKTQPPSATMDLVRSDKRTIHLYLYEDTNSPVQKRLPDYDRSIYLKEETIDQNNTYTVILQNIEDHYHYVRGIVEANYRYCVSQANKMGITQGISWAYMKNFTWPESIDLQLVQKIRFKNKSVLHAQKIYIIRKLSLDLADDTFETEICFFFNNPSA